MGFRISTQDKMHIAEMTAFRIVSDIVEHGKPSTFESYLMKTLKVRRPDCFDGNECMLSRTQYDELDSRVREQVRYQLIARGYKVK